MPIHDWARVPPGVAHDFHLAWVAQLYKCLNTQVLADDHYAMIEFARPRPVEFPSGPDWPDVPSTAVAVAEAPPRVAVQQSLTDATALADRQRRLVIRHTTGDRIVALLEIVSPGNKQRRPALDTFVDKALAALATGYQLLILDLFPPGPFDPAGIHGAIWDKLGDDFVPPPAKPLTLAAYAARRDPDGPRAPGAVTAYVEPTAVDETLIDMPLFLSATRYVNVPLEPTYRAAFEGVPKRWKRVIEGAE